MRRASAPPGTKRWRSPSAASGRYGGAAGREPPHRREAWDQGADEHSEEDEQEKLDLIANIGVKFLRKTQQERECRLSGELVAADYYLRQMTVLEVMLDLMASGWTFERTWPRLMSLRGKHSSLFMIADTPFVRLLDARRREMWAADGEPPRPPETFREGFLRDFGDHRASIDSHSFGATSEPGARILQGGMGHHEHGGAEGGARAAICRRRGGAGRVGAAVACRVGGVAGSRRAQRTVAERQVRSVEEPMPARPACATSGSDSFDEQPHAGHAPSMSGPAAESVRDGPAAPITAPNMRSFGLNSREFYEAVREPLEPPWIMAGSLPREPRGTGGSSVRLTFGSNAYLGKQFSELDAKTQHFVRQLLDDQQHVQIRLAGMMGSDIGSSILLSLAKGRLKAVEQVVASFENFIKARDEIADLVTLVHPREAGFVGRGGG
jgi:hypothetical protein